RRRGGCPPPRPPLRSNPEREGAKPPPLNPPLKFTWFPTRPNYQPKCHPSLRIVCHLSPARTEIVDPDYTARWTITRSDLAEPLSIPRYIPSNADFKSSRKRQEQQKTRAAENVKE